MYQVIDQDNYNRKATFDFYKSFEDPFFNITCNIEISNFLSFCKKNNYSFLLGMLHNCMKAANDIPVFRQRLSGDSIKEYDVIHPSSTIMKEDETFTFAYLKFFENFELFHEKGALKIAERKESNQLEPDPGKDDMIYFSSIPWISFTQFKHARSGKKDSIPRIVFGKYFNQAEKILLPISIEVHHALVDGIHVGKFVELLSKRLSEF